MFAGCESSFDVLGLTEDREGDDDGLDILTEKQVVIGATYTGVGRVQIGGVASDQFGSVLCRLEGAGEDCLDGQEVTLGNGRLGRVREGIVAPRQGASGTDQVLLFDKYATSNDGDAYGSHCDQAEVIETPGRWVCW